MEIKGCLRITKTNLFTSQQLMPPTMDGELTIHNGERNLLCYNYKTVYPPAGVDTAFKRSAFIHPLWAPHGQVLTRIQAPIITIITELESMDACIIRRWHGWLLESQSRQGTVRFGKFISVVSGPVMQNLPRFMNMLLSRRMEKKSCAKRIPNCQSLQPEDNANYI